MTWAACLVQVGALVEIWCLEEVRWLDAVLGAARQKVAHVLHLRVHIIGKR